MKSYKQSPRSFLTPDLTNSKTHFEKSSNEKQFLKKTKKFRRGTVADKLSQKNIKSLSNKIKNGHTTLNHYGYDGIDLYPSNKIENNINTTITKNKYEYCPYHPDIKAKFKIISPFKKTGVEHHREILCLNCALEMGLKGYKMEEIDIRERTLSSKKN